MKQGRTKTQMQVVSCKFSEHLLESLDPMRSIRNLHIHQQQNHLHNKAVSQNGDFIRPNDGINVSPLEQTLIMFTPPPGQHEVPQGATGKQSEPKKQNNPQKKENKK